MQKFIRKVLAALLVLAMVVGFLPVIDLGIEAKAADVATDVVYNYVFDISQYRDGERLNVEDKISNWSALANKDGIISNVYREYPGKDGYVFAGWYADGKGTTPLGTDVTEGGAYAKFVPESLINTVAQVSTATNRLSPSSSLRFIAAVDSLDYNQIGFTVTKVGVGSYIHSSTRVYTTLSAALEGVAALEPGYFGAAANYMYALTVTGIKNQSQEYTAKPFWITNDGTLVDHAESEEKTVKMGVDANTAAGKTEQVEGYQWYDSTKSEYTISTAEELKELAELSKTQNFAGKTIKLAADIAFNEGKQTDELMDNNAILEGVEAYTTIGSSSLPFAGTFDGQGHTISGIAERNTGYSGVFAAVKNATIKNLTVSRSIFRGGSGGGCSAAIAGKTYGTTTIENVNVTSDVKLYLATYMGGIVGVNDGNLSISNASSSVYVNPQWVSNGYVGGIVGANTNTAGRTLDLENCLYNGTMTGTVQGSSFVGGLVGASMNNPVTTLTDCLVSGTVGVAVGNSGTLYMGSLIGSKSWTDANTVATDVYATTESCSQVIRNDQEFASGVTTAAKADITDGLALYSASGLDYENTWAITTTSPELQAFTTKAADAFYQQDKTELFIDNAAELLIFSKLSQKTDFAGKTIKLTADITFNSGSSAADWATTAPSQVWTPAGSASVPFAGTFDGQGHTISGLYVGVTGAPSGLFSCIQGATVKNLTITNSNFRNAGVSTANYLNGTLVGKTIGGNIKGVHITSTVYVHNGYSIGGLVAYAGNSGTSNLYIDECTVSAQITMEKHGTYIGGIVGEIANNTANYIYLNNCLFNGSISGTARTTTTYIGGLYAYDTWNAKKSIQNCFVAGDLSAITIPEGYTCNIGSVIGDNATAPTTVTNVYVTSECYDKISADGGIDTKVVKMTAASYYGELAVTNAPNLAYGSTWTTVEGKTPELVFGAAKNIDTSWYDADATEYTIYTAAQLNGLAELSKTNTFAGKTIYLGADIVYNNSGDAGAWATTPPANVWTPIGNSSYRFAGTFDGQGYTISGLYYKSTGAGAAMFSEINDATIRNFNLENSYIESTHNSEWSYTGGLVAFATGTSVTFENVTCDAIVKSAGQRVGGFVGRTDTAVNITDSVFSGDITGNNNTAGFIGFVNQGKAQNLTRCVFTGTVTGIGTQAAGLIAYLKSDTACVATITDCLVAGTISGSGAYYGGLVAMGSYNAKIVAKNCLVAADMTGATGTSGGSVVGNNPGGDKSTYTNVYATTETHTNMKGGGGATFTATSVALSDILGEGAKTAAPNLDYLVTWAINEGAVPTPTGAKHEGMDFTWYGDGSATTFTLYDAEDLYGFQYLANTKAMDFAGKIIKLGADIVLNEGNAADWAETPPANINVWTGITTNFAGTFDGDGHTISGVYMNSTATYDGFFRFNTNAAVVQNLTISNSYFSSTNTSDSKMGAVFGCMQGGKLINVHVTDTIVQGAQNVGGLVGYHAGGNTLTISDCSFSGTVKTTTSEKGAGGIIGHRANAGAENITNCTVSGTVSGAHYVGGIIGKPGTGSGTITVEGCTVNANVAASGSIVGGIVGFASATTVVRDCTLTEKAVISAPTAVGGITGQNNGSLTVENCTVSGTVKTTGTSGNIGGVVGKANAAVTTTGTSVSGTISGDNCVSGFVGLLDNASITVSISDSTFSGTATATNTSNAYVGGFVGKLNQGTAKIDDCISNGDLTGAGPYGGGFVAYVANSAKAILTLNKCWFDGSVTLTSSNAGGLVGRLHGADGVYTATITKTLSTGAVTGSGHSYCQIVGANAGGVDTASDNYCYINTNGNISSAGITASSLTAVEAKFVGSLWSEDIFAMRDNFLASLDGTTYTIDSREDYFGFVFASLTDAFSGKTVKLGGDITINTGDAELWMTDAPKYNVIPVGGDGTFQGTFDGQGYTISGLYCAFAGGNSMGMFREVTGTVTNFKLVNSYFENTVDAGWGYNGVIASALTGGTVSKVYTDAIIKTIDSYAGGIVGNTTGTTATVDQCQFDGVLLARCTLDGSCGLTGSQSRDHASYVGGMVGAGTATATTISNCYFTGRIMNECGGAHRTSGILGGQPSATSVTITGCVSIGKLSTLRNNDSYHFAMFTDARLPDGTLSVPANNDTFFDTNYMLTTPAYASDGVTVINNGDTITGVTKGASTVRHTVEQMVADIEERLASDTSKLDFGNVWNYNPGELPTLKWVDGAAASTFTYADTEDGKFLTIAMEGKSYDTYTDMEVQETETGKTYIMTINNEEQTLSYYYLEQVDAAPVEFKDIFYGDGTYITKYVNTTLDDAEALIAKMKAFGFKEAVANNLNEDCYYTALTFGKYVYTVTQFVKTSETYVSVSSEQKLSPYLDAEYYTTAVNKDGGEPYTAYTDVKITSVALNNGGDAFVIRLKNGHFIVIDGGTNNQTDRDAVAAALGASADEYNAGTKNNPRIVVDAWFFTHAHADHTALFRGGIYGGIQVDVYIKGFYFNFAQKWHEETPINIGSEAAPEMVNAFVNKAYAYADQDENGKNYYTKGTGDTSEWWVYRTATHKTASNVNNPTWDGASTKVNVPIYRVQAGQKYYFDGLTVEVPYTQEQVQPSEMQLDLNGTCSWFLLTYQKADGTDGSTFLDAGDAERWNAEAVTELYSSNYKIYGTDVMKTFHHGLNPLVEFTGTFGETPGESTTSHYNYDLVDKFYGVNSSYGDGVQTKFAFITKTAATWLQISGYNNCGGSQRDVSIHEMYYLFGYILTSKYGSAIRDYENYGYATLATKIPFAAYGGEFEKDNYTDTFEGTTTVTMNDGGVTWDKYHTRGIYD